jgi:hypothetical protein
MSPVVEEEIQLPKHMTGLGTNKNYVMAIGEDRKQNYYACEGKHCEWWGVWEEE